MSSAIEVKDVVAAAAGLIGVLIGSGLSLFKDHFLQSQRDAKKRQYLCILVAFALEEFASGALAVASDDGLVEGQRDEQGCLAPSAPYPDFRPEQLAVEWTTLPAELMHEVFQLARRRADALGVISQAAEYGWGAPDYEDFFEERRLQFAALGLTAADLADRLRALAKLPARQVDPAWDTVAELRRHKREVSDARLQRFQREQAANAALLSAT